MNSIESVKLSLSIIMLGFFIYSFFPSDALAVNDDINVNKILEELLGGDKKKQSLDTVIVTNTKVLPPGNEILTPVEVRCPEGTKVTGGGYEISPPNRGIHLAESKPIDNGWRLLAATNADDVSLTVYAECGKLV